MNWAMHLPATIPPRLIGPVRKDLEAARRALRCGPANRPRPPVHTYHSDGVMRFDGNYGAGQLRAQQLRQLCIQRGLNRSQLVRKSF
jgi:hypothetical protein